ncbi:MAG: hypothetical protein A2V90_03675 [Gammaproteobacteria bacterium RBG_16_57_12]|nr:MAG: hypothetical protein A2V90_03675 [Gammaproteobacteria bacterium RBG_16_57_12]
MNTDWQSFLRTCGAELQGDALLHFGNPARELRAIETGGVLTDLSHLGLIKISGEDAVSFMQNLFSNDIKQVSGQRSQLSSLCSAKGRVLALFRIFIHAGNYYLQLPGVILEPTLKRLRMYILRSRVTVADASDDLIRIGFTCPESSHDPASLPGKLPEQADDAAPFGQSTIIKISNTPARYEVIGANGEIKKIWQVLAAQATPVGPQPWRLLDIRDGIPNIYPPTVEAFVPQMINLESLAALSFTKGCYPGQEVVARTHYLGKVKRHMYLAHVSGEHLPAPGDTVYLDLDNQSAAGKIVDCAPTSNGGHDLLAVLQTENHEPGQYYHLGKGTAALTFKNLPYVND